MQSVQNNEESLQAIRQQLLTAKAQGLRPAEALSSLKALLNLRTIGEGISHGKITRRASTDVQSSGTDDQELVPMARTARLHANVQPEAVLNEVSDVYGDEVLTPYEAVSELKNLEIFSIPEVIEAVLIKYKDLSASQLCGAMLQDDAYPEQRQTPETLLYFIKNNEEVVYDEDDVRAAIKDHYHSLSGDESNKLIYSLFGHLQKSSIRVWAGTYHGQTEWWGRYFSPLVITVDEKVFMKGVQLDCAFDAETNKLKIDSTKRVGVADPSGEISFFKKDGKPAFAGVLYPHIGDGPGGYWSVDRADGEKSLYDWEGTYIAETDYWGEHFSPLVVYIDETVTIRGVKIEGKFNGSTNTLSIPRTVIGDGNAAGEITFFTEKGRNRFSGVLYPRVIDGACGYKSR
jgi:hypothetical protein